MPHLLRYGSIPLLLGLLLVGAHAQTLGGEGYTSSTTCYCFILSEPAPGDWPTGGAKDFHIVAAPRTKMIIDRGTVTCNRIRRLWDVRARLVTDGPPPTVVNQEVARDASIEQASNFAQGPFFRPNPGQTTGRHHTNAVTWTTMPTTPEPGSPPRPPDAWLQGALNLANPPPGHHYDYVVTFLGWRVCLAGPADDEDPNLDRHGRVSWYVTTSGSQTPPTSTKPSTVTSGEKVKNPKKGTVTGKNNGPGPTPTPDPHSPVPADPNPEQVTPPPPTPTKSPAMPVVVVVVEPHEQNPDPLPPTVLASFDIQGFKGLTYEVLVSTAYEEDEDVQIDLNASPPTHWGVLLTDGAGSFAPGDVEEMDTATFTLQHAGGAPAGSKLYVAVRTRLGTEDYLWSDAIEVELTD